jgi:SAM-dependent methyltransferase
MTQKISSSGFTGLTGLLDDLLARERSKIAQKLVPVALRGGSALDIGCGTYPLFLSAMPFREKIGLDRIIDDECAKHHLGRGIRLQRYDVQAEGGRLPFQAESFDVVVMLAVFEHIPPEELPTLISQVRRVLKPGGAYILTTPAPWAESLLSLMASLGLITPESFDEHQDAYTHERIIALLDAAGFKGEEVRLGYFELTLNIWACARK